MQLRDPYISGACALTNTLGVSCSVYCWRELVLILRQMHRLACPTLVYVSPVASLSHCYHNRLYAPEEVQICLRLLSMSLRVSHSYYLVVPEALARGRASLRAQCMGRNVHGREGGWALSSFSAAALKWSSPVQMRSQVGASWRA